VFLGAERLRAGVVDRPAQRARFRELAEQVGLRINPSMTAGSLRVAEQQKLEVMRALARNARLIVMDEPTAALSRVEADRLLQVASDLRKSGVTVIFISHVLEDVLALSETVTVLKDGRLVRSSPAGAETIESLVTAMLGRSMELVFPERTPPAKDAPVLLRVRGLSRPPVFADVTFDVRGGEIVGIAGLVGSGRTEIARAIFGADSASGTVELDGRVLRARSPGGSVKRGIALLPESRKEQGLAMHRSVRENITMVHLRDVWRGGVLRTGLEKRVVQKMLHALDVRAASASMLVAALSGGNQQKVVFAKWLVRQPRLLIADEPTRGVDVGAKRAIYELVRDLAAQGVGILLISSELEEVIGLSHRILVIRAGRIVAELEGEDVDEEAIMRAAFGGEPVARRAAQGGPAGG
jgi:simple sugar transport system ATP-binding protein/ribose transport system ATP-binding protein